MAPGLAVGHPPTTKMTPPPAPPTTKMTHPEPAALPCAWGLRVPSALLVPMGSFKRCACGRARGRAVQAWEGQGSHAAAPACLRVRSARLTLAATSNRTPPMAVESILGLSPCSHPAQNPQRGSIAWQLQAMQDARTARLPHVAVHAIGQVQGKSGVQTPLLVHVAAMTRYSLACEGVCAPVWQGQQLQARAGGGRRGWLSACCWWMNGRA